MVINYVRSRCKSGHAVTLRHYATSRKVAGSIHVDVIDLSIDLILPTAVWS
jgi:hypothetical protein